MADRSRHNALRRLGITPQALLSQAFAPTNIGFIKKNEYEMFWSEVSTKPPEATVFLDEVLKRLFSSLEKASPEIGVSLESLVNTISFICLTLEFIPTDPKIKRFLENWQKQEAVKDLSRTFPPAKEVVRTLSLRVENQDMIGPLIIGCSTLHSVKEFQRLADIVSFPTLDESDIKSGESCFLYDHLRSLANNKEHLANILQSTRNKMLTLPQQMKMNPKVAETTLCALLHMLKQFMSIAAVTDVQFLKSMSTIQQFYLWPCPYGNLTRDLLLLLQAETLCPGSLLRQRLIREAYVADYLDEKGASSALFYVVDGTDRGSMAYVNSMDIRTYKPQPSRRKNDRNVDEASLLSTTTQAMIVLNMLHTDVGVHDDELRYFRALTPQNVAQLYQKTAQIMNEVNQRPDQAREIRIRGLTTIRDSLKTLATASGRAGQTIKLPEKLVDPFTPSMPSVAHLHILTKVAYDTTTKQSDLLNGETPYVLATPMVDDLRSLLSSYCNKSDKPITIRIVIAGGDELVHTFLCAYMSIRQSKPELLDGIQLRFFIAPLAKNHIAAFLARHDSWYNRHVYVPFRSPVFILPWISSDEATSQSDEKQVEIAPPGLFFRSTLESYAREAEVMCELNVYKVEGWLYATSGKKDVHADQVIPFVQRVEIGIAPATQRYRESRKIVGEIKVDDMIKDKYFEFNPPEVVVKFTKMDLSGRVQETITEEGGVYWGLLCANVPRRGDACFPPDPTSPWLEFHAKLHKNFRRETTRKNVLATDPRQHIIETEISCMLPTQNFTVLIDGQTFGPFHKIKISAAADDKANKRIKFPVQTFFPLDM